MSSKAVSGIWSRRNVGRWVEMTLASACVLSIACCARHPLPELDLDNHDQAQHPDDSDKGDGDNPDKPKPDDMTPDMDPPEDPGDGDGAPIETPESDAATQEPTPDASTSVPGDLAPHADNAGTCPKRKPTVNSPCISFSGQCRYGTAPVVECQCVGVGWFCR